MRNFLSKTRNFYYTDLYSDEHLNPKMVTNKELIILNMIEEGYKEKYLSEEKIDKLILNECINVDKLKTSKIKSIYTVINFIKFE